MKKSIFKHLALWLLMLVMVFAGACTPAADDSGNSGNDNGNDNGDNTDIEDPWADEDVYTDLSVRDATGTHGAVASANAYASKAGYDILRAGGNAFDAAVAVAFAIGVTEPYASGVGGGGVMTAYNASTGEYVFYNFREFIPAQGTFDNYEAAIGSDIPTTGIYSAGVPTEVAGLCAISEDFGQLSLAECLEPAITLAEEGFTIEATLAENINIGTFSEYGLTETVETFSYEGNGIEPLTVGDTLIQEDYAKVLRAIAEDGAAGFYTGWVAQAIVEASEANNGFITQADLSYAMNNYPKKGEPIYTSYNGYDIYTANTPSSGGIILAESLNMISHYCEKNNTTLAEIGLNTDDYIHVVGTALQLSYADKRHYIADNSINPATGSPFVEVPIEGLASKEYAAQRFDTFYNPDDTIRLTSSYDWGGASGDLSPWEFQDTEAVNYGVDVHEDDNGTTTFSIADSEGNIVSITQTLNHFWGAYIVPEGCGFFLNDQLTSFSVKETAAESVHYIAPYKQPVSHIMPTIILKDGKPFATLGSPGSMRICSAVLETVLNLIDFGMDIQTAIETPRFYNYCVSTADSSSMTGDATYRTHKLIHTENLDAAVRDELSSRNYYVYNYDSLNNFFGGVQGITFQYDSSGNFLSLHGGADPRRDGKALAY